MSSGRGRLPAIDVAKVIASQAIVLHHLAFYGPMADHAWPLAPAAFEWLARHARLAVQVFLVAAGFLAARQLAPLARWTGQRPAPMAIVDRYLRLVLPYAVALLLVIAVAALARVWMTHDSVPARPSLGAVVAHLLLLQDVLGIEALSAGVWYLAIDLQLYVLFVGVLLLARFVDLRWRAPRGAGPAAPWLMAAGVAISLFVVNRLPSWDIGAPYFLGAYGLGVLAAWWPTSGKRARWMTWVALLVSVALLAEWRSRIALAALVALLLALSTQRWPKWPSGSIGSGESIQVGAVSHPRRAPWLARMVQRWSDRSYALFLIHFPVALAVNAAFARWVPPQPALQLAGVLLAWCASLAAAAALQRWVERPLAAWLARRPRRRHDVNLPAPGRPAAGV